MSFLWRFTSSYWLMTFGPWTGVHSLKHLFTKCLMLTAQVARTHTYIWVVMVTVLPSELNRGIFLWLTHTEHKRHCLKGKEARSHAAGQPGATLTWSVAGLSPKEVGRKCHIDSLTWRVSVVMPSTPRIQVGSCRTNTLSDNSVIKHGFWCFVFN